MTCGTNGGDFASVFDHAQRFDDRWSGNEACWLSNRLGERGTLGNRHVGGFDSDPGQARVLLKPLRSRCQSRFFDDLYLDLDLGAFDFLPGLFRITAIS